ncbi:MAG: BatA domain-containing protein [Kiritimatiellia bacterium]|jgi:hypothetical protein
MDFLFPAMLAGLAGLSIPVALHLIARHRFPVRDFPSIRLIREERRNNVFAWRLVDPLQLVLRLAVLALAVFAMARIFLPGLGARPAPRNVAVVLDASASMTRKAPSGAHPDDATVFDVAVREAAALLRDVPPPGQATLLVAGDDLRVLRHVEDDPEALRAFLASLRPAGGAGVGLVHAVAEACALLRGRHEAHSQVIVVGDGRATAFEARAADDLAAIDAAREAMGSRLEIRLLDVSGAGPDNVSVSDAALRKGAVRMGGDAHVLARVRNHGTNAVQAQLRLTVLGREAPALPPVPLAPGGEAVIDLATPVNRAASGFAEVALRTDDAYPADDRALLPFQVTDPTRVLIVHDSAPPETSAFDKLGSAAPGTLQGGEEDSRIDGARILRFVLNPARESGGTASTGIDTTMVTPDAFQTQPLGRFDFVVLYDVDTLPESAIRDLEGFVEQGKALLCFASAQCNPVRFNRNFSAMLPADLGNERPLQSPVGVDTAKLSHPAVSVFSDRGRGDLGDFRFLALRDLAPREGAVVVLSDESGSPLLVEGPFGFGRVMVAAFGLELERGTMARSRTFPVLMWRIADDLAGRLRPKPPDVLPVGRPAVLDAGEPPFAFETTLELVDTAATSTVRRVMEISPSRTVMVDASPDPLEVGAYRLRKASTAGDSTAAWGYHRGIVVNPDPRESRTEALGEETLRSLFGPDARALALDDPADTAPRGVELFHLLLILLLCTYLSEAVCSWFFSAQREKARRQAGYTA